MSDDVAVYSAIYSRFDEILDVSAFSNSGIKFFLFTDDVVQPAPGWDVIECPTPKDAVLANRRLKINPPEFICDYKYSLYIDGNVFPERGFLDFIDDLLNKEVVIGVNLHPRFSNVFLDLREIVRKGVIASSDGLRDLLCLHRMSYPLDFPFYECNVIWRRSCPTVLELNNVWWAHYVNGTGRDQAAFVKSVFQLKIDVVPLCLGDNRGIEGDIISVRNHAKGKRRFNRGILLFLGVVTGKFFRFEHRIRSLLASMSSREK